MHDLVHYRRVQHTSDAKITPQNRKRKAVDDEKNITNGQPPAKKKQHASSAAPPPTPATTGIMDTEDEFMSGMSGSEGDADFQGGDSEDDIDMGSDDGMF